MSQLAQSSSKRRSNPLAIRPAARYSASGVGVDQFAQQFEIVNNPGRKESFGFHAAAAMPTERMKASSTSGLHHCGVSRMADNAS